MSRLARLAEGRRLEQLVWKKCRRKFAAWQKSRIQNAVCMLDTSPDLLPSHVSRQDIRRHECLENEPDKTPISPRNEPGSRRFKPDLGKPRSHNELRWHLRCHIWHMMAPGWHIDVSSPAPENAEIADRCQATEWNPACSQQDKSLLISDFNDGRLPRPCLSSQVEFGRADPGGFLPEHS